MERQRKQFYISLLIAVVAAATTFFLYGLADAQENTKEFIFGIDAVGFHIDEANETVEGTLVEIEDQSYTLRIKNTVQTEYDTIFYRIPSVALGVDSNKTVIVPDSVFGGLGTYEIQVAATRFVEGNEPSKRFIDGEYSEPLFANIARQLIGNFVKVSWESNSESDLAGYKIYFGSRSQAYTTVIDVGNVLEYFVDQLQTSGITYYFVVTAYDLTGNESEFSEEVFVSFNDEDPPVKVNIRWEEEE